MNCREARPLLPLFADGELDARQMRGVALHSTRCPECEAELRQTERLQDLVSEHVNALAEDIDLSRIWTGVAPRIATISPSWRRRLLDWWEGLEIGWEIKLPAAAAAVAAVAALVFWHAAPREEAAAVAVAAVDNSAIVDSVSSDIDSVALLSEPETNTMVLWVSDDVPGEGIAPADFVVEETP